MKNMIVAIISIAAMCAGCAKWQNEVASNGGLIGSYKGHYIIRNDSGGRIMDVWILKDAIVQEEHQGAGWLFRDNFGNPIHLGGDVKIIRVSDEDSVAGKYHEYHAEFERKTYQELHAGVTP